MLVKKNKTQNSERSDHGTVKYNVYVSLLTGKVLPYTLIVFFFFG